MYVRMYVRTRTILHAYRTGKRKAPSARCDATLATEHTMASEADTDEHTSNSHFIYYYILCTSTSNAYLIEMSKCIYAKVDEDDMEGNTRQSIVL